MQPPKLAVIVAALVIVLAAVYLPRWLAKGREHRAALRALKQSWGQPFRRARDDRPLDARTPADSPPGSHRLDEQTWSDLDMPRVFTRIDRTLSSVGAQVLHRMLRCPLIDPAAIARRQALVTAVAVEPDARVAMQLVLVQLGERHGWQAANAVDGTLPVLPGPVWLLRLLPLAMAAALVAGVMLSHSVLLGIGLALALGLPIVHTLTNRRIAAHLEAVADMRRILVVADGLRTVLPAGVRELLDDLLDHVRPLRRAFGRITERSTSRLGESAELAAEYGRAFALTELIAYQRAAAAIARRRDDYIRVLEMVGEIDAALSIAYLRAFDDDLHDAEVAPGVVGLSAAGVRHPLIIDAVGNDVELGPRGLLITGSNMAGKSTLLRAIAIDTVLAQSLGLAAADRWRSRPLRVATAMGAHDDLAGGISLSRAEVDRIHALVDDADGIHLFVLDEAFRGTNPHERVAASAAVLRFLAATDLVAAATHDRDLCVLLETSFTLGYFAEQVDGDDVLFDFRLRPGVLQTTNAIALLERTGFPAAIIAEARRIASEEHPTPMEGTHKHP